MVEEQGFQSPDGHLLCVNDYGFFGSPARQNMCSKCFRKKSSADPPLFSPPLTSSPQSSFSAAPQPSAAPLPVEVEMSYLQPAANRCATCRKKVGLTGFRCRCGWTFCGSHRYAEKHGCSFDFKAMGREAIARANPVVKADKLQKI